MRRTRSAGVFASSVIGATVVLVALLQSSCLDPTQITLEVSTDVGCGDAKGTTFTGDKDGKTTEIAPPTTVTDRCVGGEIGTLVATPSGDKDTNASFLIALGVDVPVSECTAARHHKGCVVQRRSIRYVKHKPINLPIRMWLICKDVECDAESTCARNGKCVPSRIQNPERCADGPCWPDGDTPDVPAGDSGRESGSEGGPNDGGPITDGNTMKDGDADADSSIVVPPPPPPGTLFCPPIPNGCGQATNCCWDRGGAGGHCGLACSGSEITLQCDRKTDCLNPGYFCCGTVLNSGGAIMSAGPHGANVTPEAGTPEAGTRTLMNTSCGMFPGTCDTLICVTNADCPPAYPTCNKDSTLFQPTGIFGECVAP